MDAGGCAAAVLIAISSERDTSRGRTACRPDRTVSASAWLASDGRPGAPSNAGSCTGAGGPATASVLPGAVVLPPSLRSARGATGRPAAVSSGANSTATPTASRQAAAMPTGIACRRIRRARDGATAERVAAANASGSLEGRCCGPASWGGCTGIRACVVSTHTMPARSSSEGGHCHAAVPARSEGGSSPAPVAGRSVLTRRSSSHPTAARRWCCPWPPSRLPGPSSRCRGSTRRCRQGPPPIAPSRAPDP